MFYMPQAIRLDVTFDYQRFKFQSWYKLIMIDLMWTPMFFSLSLKYGLLLLSSNITTLVHRLQKRPYSDNFYYSTVYLKSKSDFHQKCLEFYRNFTTHDFCFLFFFIYITVQYMYFPALWRPKNGRNTTFSSHKAR